MNSISYFYKNLLKEKIKKELNLFADDVIDNILTSLCDTNSTNPYISLVSSIQENIRNLICTIITSTFEEIDNNMFHLMNVKVNILLTNLMLIEL